MKAYTLGVIIPTYNRASMLKRTIESVLRQDYQNITHIVVTDDGSTDNTREVVEEFQKRDSRIVYIQNTKYMKGPTGNKNNGLDYIEYEAKPDFFCILDDDDELLPNAISTLIKICEQNPDYDIVIGNCVNNDGNFTGRHYGKSEELDFVDFLCERYVGNYFGLVRTSLLKGKRFKEETWGGESILWLSLRKNARKTYYYHGVFKRYELRGERVSKKMVSNAKRAFLNYKYVLDLFEEDYLNCCPNIYARRCLTAALFAKLSDDKENFRKYIKLAFERHKGFKTFLIAFTLFLPNPLLIFLRFKVWSIVKRFFY
ncbi:MAG: glycosyltransferase family A protein [Thermodesulfovibrio sp.]|nr:glycosyltransferase family A protein [Thermodesulfovibrio sp.]